MLERRVVGMKSKRDESLEAVCFTLERAQLEPRFERYYERYDVPKEMA